MSAAFAIGMIFLGVIGVLILFALVSIRNNDEGD